MATQIALSVTDVRLNPPLIHQEGEPIAGSSPTFRTVDVVAPRGIRAQGATTHGPCGRGPASECS